MTSAGKQSAEGGAGRKAKAARPRATKPAHPDEERLSAYLAPQAVFEGLVESKEDLLLALARVVLPDSSETLVQRIYGAILERESSVNTYVGEGVAIPHARVDCVEGLHLAIAKNPAGYPYGYQTDQPVRVVVLVVGNDALVDEHMRVLGAIAKLLRDPIRREEILRAPDVSALRRLLDSSRKEKMRRKPRPLSQVLISYSNRIGRELGVTAVIVSIEKREELAMIQRAPRTKGFIVATSSPAIAEEAEGIQRRTVLLPKVPIRREARIRLATLMALTHGLIQRGDVVAVLSGDVTGSLDSFTVLEVGREFGRFVTASGEVSRGILPVVLERIITLATELSLEGREGRPLGTIFVVGDPEKLSAHCQQMVMNPFRGYPEEERNILDPTLAETVKEFAAIDGAFVIRGDGVVVSAGTWLKAHKDTVLPGGYGSRHLGACGITDGTGAVAVALSQSTGEVTVFKSGSVVLSLPREA